MIQTVYIQIVCIWDQVKVGEWLSKVNLGESMHSHIRACNFHMVHPLYKEANARVSSILHEVWF